MIACVVDESIDAARVRDVAGVIAFTASIPIGDAARIGHRAIQLWPEHTRLNRLHPHAVAPVLETLSSAAFVLRDTQN